MNVWGGLPPAFFESAVDGATLDANEAAQYLQEVGFTDLQDVDAEQFLANNPSELAGFTAIDEFAAPRTVTFDEAKQFLADNGYVSPTDEEVNQFVGQANDANYQSQQQTATDEYVDPRMVTDAEARQLFVDSGYNPTDEEVAQFVGQANDANYQSNQQTAAGEYVDPRMVSEAEVRAAYEALGLQTPVDADVQALVGQYAQSDLAGKAESGLDSARYNSLVEQVGRPTTEVTQSDIDAINTTLLGVEADPNAELTPDQLSRDANNDGVINQQDVDLLTQILAGTNINWSPPETSVWAPTGLYGELETAQQAEEQARQSQARQARTTQGRRAINQLQGITGQMAAAAPKYTPIYGGQSMGFVPGQKFDPNVFGSFLRGQDAKNENKMARGGYVDNTNDDFENILRMLQS